MVDTKEERDGVTTSRSITCHRVSPVPFLANFISHPLYKTIMRNGGACVLLVALARKAVSLWVYGAWDMFRIDGVLTRWKKVWTKISHKSGDATQVRSTMMTPTEQDNDRRDHMDVHVSSLEIIGSGTCLYY